MSDVKVIGLQELIGNLEKLIGIFEKHLTAENEKAQSRPAVIHINGLCLESEQSMRSFFDFCRMAANAAGTNHKQEGAAL